MISRFRSVLRSHLHICGADTPDVRSYDAVYFPVPLHEPRVRNKVNMGCAPSEPAHCPASGKPDQVPSPAGPAARERLNKETSTDLTSADSGTMSTTTKPNSIRRNHAAKTRCVTVIDPQQQPSASDGCTSIVVSAAATPNSHAASSPRQSDEPGPFRALAMTSYEEMLQRMRSDAELAETKKLEMQKKETHR